LVAILICIGAKVSAAQNTKHPLSFGIQQPLNPLVCAALVLRIQAARREVREGEGMIMTEELTARMRVLRRLGYLDKEGLVTQKGHVSESESGVPCRVLQPP
jgi:hypothetical protein